MKKLLVISLLFIVEGLTAQNLEGAWRLVEVNANPVTDQETVRIYQDGYFAYGSKEVDSNEFIEAGGGEYSQGEAYIEYYDFNTADTSMVGNEYSYELAMNNDELTITGKDNNVWKWKRISENQNDLNGNWVITGRQRNGEIRTSTPGARRTIKILGGDRFQWVAFNSETREFSGTGGGIYSAQDGKYTENITFFSRDKSRVGANLEFNYKIDNGKWHHSGKSSKGEPLYEIWPPYAEAYTE